MKKKIFLGVCGVVVVTICGCLIKDYADTIAAIDRKLTKEFSNDFYPYFSLSSGYGVDTDYYIAKDSKSKPVRVSVSYSINDKFEFKDDDVCFKYEALEIQPQVCKLTATASASSLMYSRQFNVNFILPSYRDHFEYIFFRKFKETTVLKWTLGNLGVLADSSEDIDAYDMELANFRVVNNGHNYSDRNYMFSTSLKTLRYSEIDYHKDLYGTHDYTFDIHYYDFSTNTYTGNKYSKIESACNVLKQMFIEYEDYEMMS